MLGLGNVGNIGQLIGAVIALGITAIVLLTFAPTVAGDVDGIFAQGKNACVYQGERFTQVVTAGTNDPNTAWLKSGGGTLTKGAKDSASAACIFGTLAEDVYTPKGTEIAAGSFTLGVLAGSTWAAPSDSVSALAGGSLVLLLLGAMAILLPAGALGFLAYTGSEMVRSYFGGSTLALAIGATVSVVVIGSILPEIFTPLDNMFSVMNGHRFIVYSEGIGKLAGVLSNFFAISLIAGLVALGAMLWKSHSSETEGT